MITALFIFLGLIVIGLLCNGHQSGYQRRQAQREMEEAMQRSGLD